MKSTTGYIKVSSPPDFTTNYKTHPPLMHLQFKGASLFRWKSRDSTSPYFRTFQKSAELI